MIASGFYYTGYGDRVTCFHCGIILRNREQADDVDLEHKKHSPDCKFFTNVSSSLNYGGGKNIHWTNL